MGRVNTGLFCQERRHHLAYGRRCNKPSSSRVVINALLQIYFFLDAIFFLDIFFMAGLAAAFLADIFLIILAMVGCSRKKETRVRC